MKRKDHCLRVRLIVACAEVGRFEDSTGADA